MDKQYRAFISYSRTNKDFAISLAKELRAKGYPVWLDQLDIPLGERWDREVERALKECEIFLIILTPDSINSENVMDEMGYAIDHHKHFMPILLESCEIPLRLRRFQYLNFTDKNFEEGIKDAGEFFEGLITKLALAPEQLPQDQVAKKNTDPRTALDAESLPSLSATSNEDHLEEVDQSESPTIFFYPIKLPDTLVSKPRPPQSKESYPSSSNSLPAKTLYSSVSIPSRKQPANLGPFGLMGVVFSIMLCIMAGVVLGRIIQAGLLTSPAAPTGATTIATNMLMSAGQPNAVPEMTMGSGTMPPLYVRIKRITVDPSGNYVVDFEVVGYTSQVPGVHMHFFFDTVPVDQAGSPGNGPWYLYTGQSPFTKYREIDRPDAATQMCVLVAKHDHSVIPGTGNCQNLP